jgi:MFS family permease
LCCATTAAAAGAAAAAAAAAVIADIYPPSQRGTASGAFMIPLLIGPVIGPLLGGGLSDVSAYCSPRGGVYMAVLCICRRSNFCDLTDYHMRSIKRCHGWFTCL